MLLSQVFLEVWLLLYTTDCNKKMRSLTYSVMKVGCTVLVFVLKVDFDHSCPHVMLEASYLKLMKHATRNDFFSIDLCDLEK